MNMPIRFLLYVVSLNLIRYFFAGPLEQMTIMEPMHSIMPRYPEFFNAEFGSNDLIIGFVYNFGLWLAVALVFHLTHPVFSGLLIWRSLKVFGLMLIFYISLTALFMNHHTDAIKPFYLYSMLDGLIVFLVVGVGNGLIYRLFFKPKSAHFGEAAVPAAISQETTRPPLPTRKDPLLSEDSAVPTKPEATAPVVEFGGGTKPPGGPGGESNSRSRDS